MKINFTKKEYRKLIDLIHLGEMVVNGIRTGDDTVKEYEELREYIYSFSKQMGCENIIQFDKQFNMHFETREYDESRIRDYVEEYDNEVFWTEFASRMAIRDIKRMQLMEREQSDSHKSLENVWKREGMYLEEFETNSLDNVKVEFQHQHGENE